MVGQFMVGFMHCGVGAFNHDREVSQGGITREAKPNRVWSTWQPRNAPVEENVRRLLSHVLQLGEERLSCCADLWGWWV